MLYNINIQSLSESELNNLIKQVIALLNIFPNKIHLQLLWNSLIVCKSQNLAQLSKLNQVTDLLLDYIANILDNQFIALSDVIKQDFLNDDTMQLLNIELVQQETTQLQNILLDYQSQIESIYNLEINSLSLYDNNSATNLDMEQLQTSSQLIFNYYYGKMILHNLLSVIKNYSNILINQRNIYDSLNAASSKTVQWLEMLQNQYIAILNQLNLLDALITLFEISLFIYTEKQLQYADKRNMFLNRPYEQIKIDMLSILQSNKLI